MATKTTKPTKPTRPVATRRPKCPVCGNALRMAHWDLVEHRWRGRCATPGCAHQGRWVDAAPRAPHEASKPEQAFIDIVKTEPDIPIPTAELYFHQDVAWRLDFGWLDEKVAVAIQGGVWMASKAGKRYSGSRHLHPAGYVRDCYKYNAAAAMGWRIVFLAEPHLRKAEYVAALLADLLL